MLAFTNLNSNAFKHLVYEIWEKEKGMENGKGYSGSLSFTSPPGPLQARFPLSHLSP
jgi:hypothetical protein